MTERCTRTVLGATVVLLGLADSGASLAQQSAVDRCREAASDEAHNGVRVARDGTERAPPARPASCRQTRGE